MAETAKKKSAPRKSAPTKVILTKESPVPPTHHDVELLAYQQWENRGRQHGDDATGLAKG